MSLQDAERAGMSFLTTWGFSLKEARELDAE